MGIKYYDGKKWLNAGGFTKLWGNPNTATSFSAQTVSLDLSKYDFVMIQSRLSTNSSGRCCTIIPVGNLGACFLKSASSNTLYSRQADVSTVGVSFDGGYNGTTPGNTYCIPEKIYGI